VAEHADLWNIPGGGDPDNMEDLLGRSALLDLFCAEIGRDPGEITRSIHLPVDYDRPAATRDAIGAALEAGFGHVILGLPAPYPEGVARWVADEVITRAHGRATAATR